MTAVALAARDGDLGAAAVFVRVTQVDAWRVCQHLGDPDTSRTWPRRRTCGRFRSLRTFEARASARTLLLSIARRSTPTPSGRGNDSRGPTRSRRCSPSRSRPATSPRGVALRTALAGLDEDRHEAFVLTQVVGLSYAQAAKACDRPIGRIRSRVARAHFVDAITGERRPALTRPCRRRTAV